MSQDRTGIHTAICAVMSEIGAVGKTRKNAGQGYNYRGIADVTKAAQLCMAKAGVHVTPEEITETRTEKESKSGGKMQHVVLKVRFRFFASDGSWIDCTTIGEALDSGDKSANKAMSASLKYALLQVFMIPEEASEDDTEASSPEIIATPAPKASLPILPAKAVIPSKEAIPLIPKA